MWVSRNARVFISLEYTSVSSLETVRLKKNKKIVSSRKRFDSTLRKGFDVKCEQVKLILIFMYEYQKQGSITKLPCIIYGFKNITFAHNLLVYLYGLSFSHIGTSPELVNCLAKQFRHCIKTCYQIYTPPRSIIQSISVYYGKYFGTVPVTFQLTTHSNKRNIHEVIISGDYVQGTSYNPVSNGSLST